MLKHASWLAVCLAAAASAASAEIKSQKAAAVFQEARTICERDAAALWGRSLCGPILLVDPTDRAVRANQADASGLLKPDGATFVGVLPASENIANTAVTWAGVRWTEMAWPLRDEGEARSVLIAHELFHRIQPDLALTRPREGDNQHLDTLEGRYLLQLEWRALAVALRATTPAARDEAIDDALLFRAARYARFPEVRDQEAALELNEGLAEYTGVRAGLTSSQARIAYAADRLRPFAPGVTFVRSFAYATGPAYGLLLDAADPNWRKDLVSGRGLDARLRMALGRPDPDLARAQSRAARYDDGTLRASEARRDAEVQARIAANRAKFVDGPVLRLPLAHMKYQFNPQTLQPLGLFGTVYPTARLVDDWGVVEVQGGALMTKDRKAFVVSAVGVDPAAPRSGDWTLQLNPGWVLVAGERPGDLIVKPAACQTQGC